MFNRNGDGAYQPTGRVQRNPKAISYAAHIPYLRAAIISIISPIIWVEPYVASQEWYGTEMHNLQRFFLKKNTKQK